MQQDELYAGLYDIHINTLPFYQMLLFNAALRVLFRHTLLEHLFTLCWNGHFSLSVENAGNRRRPYRFLNAGEQ